MRTLTTLAVILLALNAIPLHSVDRKPGTVNGAQRADDKARKKNPENIILVEIKGRHWLVSPDGNPFFAHGITHAGNRLADLDFQKFSKACKELGFNAYGYGCPPQLRKDMPYVASWNHLVPISYYRGKNGIKFVDVFDPKAQARLEAGVKAYCLVNAKTSRNLIGYCLSLIPI